MLGNGHSEVWFVWDSFESRSSLKKKKKNCSPSKGGTDCSKGQFYHSFFKCMLPGKGSLVKLCS